MKIKVVLLVLSIAFAFSVNAQSFFGPLPKAHDYLKSKLSYALGAVDSSNLTMNAIRPVVAISALVSNGAQLASGFGAGFGHFKWNEASQSWLTVYSISTVAFIGTNGNNITGTGGLVFGIPGTNGIIGVGPGYDFTGKQIVLLTGVQIQFK